MRPAECFDMVVVGSGPAGQKAAIQAAKANVRVALVERDNRLGGNCVYRGTIPSKTLHCSATQWKRSLEFGQNSALREMDMEGLMSRLRGVLNTHDQLARDQLERNGVKLIHGRASLAAADLVEVERVQGECLALHADRVILATGSRPRIPDNIPVDHEQILDSDSILSLCYLPHSLVVLGSGVIACEYASIFACLGCEVTIVDRFPRPLGFLDVELTDGFLHSLEDFGSHFIANQEIASVDVGPFGGVNVTLVGGQCVEAEKMLVAAGREASVQGLNLERLGIELDGNGLIPVDANCQTAVPNVYAVGDVIGAPALASAAMEQGRRASRHALGLSPGSPPDTIPAGIFTIPEIASVGLSEARATEQHGSVLVGIASFNELSRGKIAGMTDGLLKLVCDARGVRLLGAQIIGEGAAELIHLAQMAIVTESPVDIFIDNIFNFPTLAEAYRGAALRVAAQREGQETGEPARAVS